MTRGSFGGSMLMIEESGIWEGFYQMSQIAAAFWARFSKKKKN